VIDAALRPALGNWVFGCDDCQTVCPWNRFAVNTLEPTLALVDPERAAPRLSDWLALTEELEVERRFGRTPLARTGRERLVRNACIAAGNSKHAPLAEAVAPLLAARWFGATPPGPGPEWPPIPVRFCRRGWPAKTTRMSERNW